MNQAPEAGTRILCDCGNTCIKVACGADRARLSAAELPTWLADHPAAELLLLPTAASAASAVRAAWRGVLREVGRDLPLPQRGQYAGMGADRVVAGLAASHPCIVVDAGTATTLTAWDACGRYAGGLILPGPAAMIRGLAAAAPALPVVDPLPADAAAAQHDTAGAIAAAAGIGHPAMVAACLQRLRAETGITEAVLTGGGGAALVPLLHLPLRPWLVLDGLAILK